MTLSRLQVTDFRSLQSAQLSFDSRFSLISGPNASGKTSVLESIYLLGRGRSFRTRKLESLICSGADRFVVFGETESVVNGLSRKVGLGVEGSCEGLRSRISGVAAGSLSELAISLPVQIIDPEVHRLIEEGPSRRRRFLDWGVFHVERSFITTWQRYQLTLRQRNAALKARQPRAVVTIWDPELSRLGELISNLRRAYIDRLRAEVAPIAANLLSREISLLYRSGWSRDQTLAEALNGSWILDQERGLTHVGPQRAELQIRLDGVLARDRISRGQQKLLAAALLVAQIKFFPSDSPVRPTLLLDDPAAELDAQRLMALISEVSEQPVQLIVTTLAGELPAFGNPGVHYKIDNGVVRAA